MNKQHTTAAEETKKSLAKKSHLYDQLWHRLVEGVEAVEQVAWPALRDALNKGVDLVSDIEQLTQEESDLLLAYLKRDLHSLFHYLSETGKDVKDWINIDAHLIEDRILDNLNIVADRTTTERNALQMRLQSQDNNIYQAGEIACVGNFQCAGCGAEFQMLESSMLKPCHQCGDNVFERLSD